MLAGKENLSEVNAVRGKRRLHGANRPTAPRRLIAAERARKALEMYRSGFTSFADIGHHLGISKAAAYKAYKRALDVARPNPEAIREYIAQEVDRLDRLQVAWWLRALSGDRDAAAIVLKCIEGRARLLGLHDTDILKHADRMPAPTTKAGTDGEAGSSSVDPDVMYQRAMELLERAQEQGG